MICARLKNITKLIAHNLVFYKASFIIKILLSKSYIPIEKIQNLTNQLNREFRCKPFEAANCKAANREIAKLGKQRT